MKRLFIILFLLYALSAHATTYYISASGSTGNSGTDVGHTWPISKLYSFAYGSDDFILLNKGTTYTGSGSFTGAGTSGHPVIVYAYGNGTNPVIDAGGSSTQCMGLASGHAFVYFYNIVFQNSTASTGLVYINGTHDITIRNCYFNTGVRSVLVNNTTGNIIINSNYHTLITDPSIGSNGGGSKVQVTNSHLTAGSVHIDSNYLYEPTPNNGIGDQISFYKAFGTASLQYTANYNKIRGGSSNAAGFCGINLGDNDGSNQQCNNNIIISSGSVGVQMTGGDSCIMNNNSLYCPSGITVSVVGITYGAFIGSRSATLVTISNNIICWTDHSGAIDNAFWSTSTQPVQPTGWTTNGTPGVCNSSANNSMLSATVFNVGDWNSPIISYSASYSLPVGISVSKSPTNAGTASTNWTCSPTLPAGLSINSGTGVITGTPTTMQAAANYTISATNANGTGTYVVSIAVTGSGGGKLFFTSSGKLVTRF